MTRRCSQMLRALVSTLAWLPHGGLSPASRRDGPTAPPARSWSGLFPVRLLPLIAIVVLAAASLRTVTPGAPLIVQAMPALADPTPHQGFLPVALDSWGLMADPTPTRTPAATLTPPPCVGPFELTGLSAHSGDPGAELTLYGCGFGTDKTRVTVNFIQRLYWGPVMPAEVVSCSDTRIVVKVPRPTGEASWDIDLSTTVQATVGGSMTAELPFQITDIPPDPPRIYAIGGVCAEPGASITIDADGLAPTAAQNLVSFSGALAAADSGVFGGEAGMVHRGHINVTVPTGATSGPVRLKRLDGIDAWSEPYNFQVRTRATLTLAPGLEAEGILGSSSWLLGGSGFSKVYNWAPSMVPGLVFLEVTTPVQTLTLSGYAMSDTQLAVPYILPEFYQGLKGGDPVTVRARGMDCSDTVYSNVLTLEYRDLFRGTAVSLPVDLTLSAEQTHVALSRGDYACLYLAGATQPDDAVQNVRAEGLWEGTLPFHHNRLRTKCFPARTAGAFAIQNDTTGRSLPYEVRQAGVYYEEGLVGTWKVAESFDPAVGVTVGFGGGRLTIPPGALPSTSSVYMVEAMHLESSATPYDGVQSDGGHQFSIKFTPEPSELLQPITIVLPYGSEGLVGTPRFGAFERETGVYLEMEAVVDAAQQTVTVELPAQTYAADAGTAAGLLSVSPSVELPLWGDVKAAINSLLDRVCVARDVYARCSVTDKVDSTTPWYFTVDFACDPRSESYVDFFYAKEVLDTLVQTRAKLVSGGWMAPPRLTVHIRKLATTDGGSTTKAIFGVPWVYMHSKVPMGPELKTVTAHELGHAFQRVYTKNIIAQWIDEATAQWVAFHLLGSGVTMQGDLFLGGDFVSIGIPDGLTWGYATEQEYAAGAFVIWMARQYGDSSILSMYQLLSVNPLYWYDSYGTFSTATGAPMAEIMTLFGRDYWTQSYSPVDVPGFPQGPPWTPRWFAVWDGAFIEDPRPAMSAHGYAVGVAANQASYVVGRPGIVRVRAIGPDQLVYVYGDTAALDRPIGTLTYIGMLDATTRHLTLNPYDRYPTYRLIVVNGTTAEATPSLHVVVPYLSPLLQASGSTAGGYSIHVNGRGFGESAGTVTIGGVALTQGAGIEWWNDTAIRITVPPHPAGDVDVRVQTAEGILVPETRKFTYIDETAD